MDSENLTSTIVRRQATPELSAANKRLLLSAHFEFLLFKRLRRGLPIEEGELLALLPFTVPNGWQSEGESEGESDDDSNGAAGIDVSDADWAQRVTTAGAI